MFGGKYPAILEVDMRIGEIGKFMALNLRGR